MYLYCKVECMPFKTDNKIANLNLTYIYAGYCWRSRDELIRDVLLWTPTHGRAKAGRPARTYIQQLCEDTRCCPEDLPRAMNDREEWRERVRDIRTTSARWWWWWWWWWWYIRQRDRETERERKLKVREKSTIQNHQQSIHLRSKIYLISLWRTLIISLKQKYSPTKSSLKNHVHIYLKIRFGIRYFIRVDMQLKANLHDKKCAHEIVLCIVPAQ